HEAYCQDNDIVCGNVCLLDWPVANIYGSTHLYLVGELLSLVVVKLLATFVLRLVARMLRPIKGWSWADAVSNLPARSCSVAAEVKDEERCNYLGCLTDLFLFMPIP
ncbi:hypothetical protein C3L33_07279, partial [Rhododendron williamsianum]